MTYSTLRVDVDDDGVARVTICRPDKMNALNAEVLSELSQTFEACVSSSEVRGILVTGEGSRAFVAGADIAEFQGLSAEEAESLSRRGQEVFGTIERSPKPVIAAVNGFALGGGCELAMACHLRVAAESARFGQPEVGLGLIPGFGGTQRLPRLVGAGIALQWLMTGEMIDAKRAHETGLVNRVVPDDDVLSEAKSLMTAILSKGPVAVALVLEAARNVQLPLDEGLKREAELFGRAFESEDFGEGVAAFLEKRAPRFRGT